MCVSGEVNSSEGMKVTDLVHKNEQLGTVFNRIAAYETVSNLYDEIGT